MRPPYMYYSPAEDRKLNNTKKLPLKKVFSSFRSWDTFLMGHIALTVKWSYYAPCPAEGRSPPKAVNGQGRAGCLYVTYTLMCTYKVRKVFLNGESGYYRVVLLEVTMYSKWLHIWGQTEATFWQLGSWCTEHMRSVKLPLMESQFATE